MLRSVSCVGGFRRAGRGWVRVPSAPGRSDRRQLCSVGRGGGPLARIPGPLKPERTAAVPTSTERARELYARRPVYVRHIHMYRPAGPRVHAVFAFRKYMYRYVEGVCVFGSMVLMG